MKKIISAYLLSSLLLSCIHSGDAEVANAAAVEIPEYTPLTTTEKERQDLIIEEHFYQGALKYQVYSQDRQREIDKGLAKDPTTIWIFFITD